MMFSKAYYVEVISPAYSSGLDPWPPQFIRFGISRGYNWHIIIKEFNLWYWLATGV